MQWQLTLERKSENRLNYDISRKTLRRIAKVAERNAAFGFKAKVSKLVEPELVVDEEDTTRQKYRYVVKLRLEESKAKSADVAAKRFEKVFENLKKVATNLRWTVLGQVPQHAVNGQVASIPATIEERPAFLLPDLTPQFIDKHFQGIYEREPHIRIIHSAAKTFQVSGGKKASHVLLFGSPASAKSQLFERFKRAYEENSPVERVVQIDATALTKAGLERWLLQRAEDKDLPEILLLEEIEKQSPDHLLCLLSVMASGFFIRTNATAGRIHAKTQITIWATCNDEDFLRNFRNGALHSRFTHRLECRRPSKKLMHKILLRELSEIPGSNPIWADKALELADQLKTDDPRTIIGLLDGREELITGQFQRDVLATRKIEKTEGATQS